jgi:hypothetical protein
VTRRRCPPTVPRSAEQQEQLPAQRPPVKAAEVLENYRYCLVLSGAHRAAAVQNRTENPRVGSSILPLAIENQGFSRLTPPRSGYKQTTGPTGNRRLSVPGGCVVTERLQIGEAVPGLFGGGTGEMMSEDPGW